MNLSQTKESDALLEAARSLRPQIELYADQVEAERQLPPPLVDALADAGLFKMLVPKAVGGSETDPATFCRVLEELSQADGSTGWSVFVSACVGAAGGTFREDVAWAIFGKEPKACVAGSGAPAPNPSQRPPDRAIVVDGGYGVTGRWSFTSGCRHATWLMGASALYEGEQLRIDDNGNPAVRFMFFPVAVCQIIDTWHVTGLRGSGSHDFAVTDVFVPTGVASIGVAAVCLRIARGALDALIELAAVKTLGGGNLGGDKGRLRDNPIVQDQVGRAEATLRAVRAYLYATIREEWEHAVKSGFCTRQQHSLLRLAATHATTLSAQVVDTAWNAAGASAIFGGNPIECRFRDLHVATQNIAIRAEHYVTAGQMFLGFDQA